MMVLAKVVRWPCSIISGAGGDDGAGKGDVAGVRCQLCRLY